jgi:hypothetical protein
MTAERELPGDDAQDCAYPPHPGLPARRPEGGSRTAASRPRRRAAAGLRAWARHAPAERVPLLAVPAVWTAAEIMHAAGTAGYGPGVATMVAASIAYGTGERRARRSEHPALEGAERAAVVGVPGAWLTAATVLGPLWGRYDLMTSVLYTGITVGGYWWLRHRDAVQAARARRDAAAEEAARLAAEETAWLARKAEWHRLAPKVGLQGSDLLAVESNQNGSETWVIDTYGAKQQLADHVNCKTAAQRLSGEKLLVAGGHRVPKNRIEVAPHPEWAYQLLVTIRGQDLWQGGSDQGFIWHPIVSGDWDPALPYADLVPETTSIRDPITLGADPETGRPLQLTLWDNKGARRVLVVGTSRSGKSMLLDTIRERVTACTDAILLQINLSKGIEDSWWAPLTAASALSGDHARALRVLDFISDVILERPRSRTPGVRVHQPTAGEPAFVVMIDEVDKVANDDDRKHQLGQIASKCASEGVILILGGQRPVNQWIGGAGVRANISDVVWGRMRASDTRHAGGGDSIDLPDMGDYGGGNPGVFGVAAHPTYEGMPFSRGRAFFWGDESTGMIALIERRAAARRPYQLEPGLSGLAAAWAQITGTPAGAGQPAPAQQQARRREDRSEDRHEDRGEERYDIKVTRDGSTVPSGAGVQRKLDAAREVIDADLPAGLRARMQAGVPDEVRQAEKQQALAADPLPAAEQAALWDLVSAPGGISGREAARQLQRPQPGRSITWSHTTVINQLRLWESGGRVERTGRGRSDTRWHAVPAGSAPRTPYLHAVADGEPPAPAPDQDQDAGGTGGELTGQVLGPGEFTGQQAALMVAFWVLKNGAENAIEAARACGMPDPVIVYALHLAENEPDYVKAETRQVLADAGVPVPAWLGPGTAGGAPAGDRSEVR